MALRSVLVSRVLFMVALMALTGATGCSSVGGIEGEAKYPTTSRDDLSDPNAIHDKSDSIFGKGGAGLFSRKEDDSQTGIGVNSYLWRASLDTVAFMPLSSADPFGGVILTDWYSPPETPDERLKLNVFILDKQLKADGIQVKVFRQVRKKGGDWRDAETDPATGRQIEDAILTRARQMRVAKSGGQ